MPGGNTLCRDIAKGQTYLCTGAGTAVGLLLQKDSECHENLHTRSGQAST